MRRDNLQIVGLIEERNEDEETLLVKVTEVATGMWAIVEPEDISTVHQLDRPGNANWPVIVCFCRKHKKKELKKNGRKIYENDTTTSFTSKDCQVAGLCIKRDHARQQDTGVVKDSNQRVEVSM